MTENELVETPAPTQNQAEEATKPEVAPDATDGAEKPAEPTKTPEQLEIERLKRELAHKERALTKRDRTQGKQHLELEKTRRELEQLRQRQAAQPNEQATTPRVSDEREVDERAEFIASGMEFNTKTDAIVQAGKKEFKDFSEAVEALIDEAGPLVVPTGHKFSSGHDIVRPSELGELILDSDNPAALIHFLGKNPELAAELDGLKTAQLARKLVAIEAQMTAKPKTSAAPKPLEPVKAQTSSKDPSDMTDREFAIWRKAQIKQRGTSSV